MKNPIKTFNWYLNKAVLIPCRCGVILHLFFCFQHSFAFTREKGTANLFFQRFIRKFSFLGNSYPITRLPLLSSKISFNGICTWNLLSHVLVPYSDPALLILLRKRVHNLTEFTNLILLLVKFWWLRENFPKERKRFKFNFLNFCQLPLGASKGYFDLKNINKTLF